MGFDRRVRNRRDCAVTGNLYVLLGVAEAIVSLLPSAVHRSKTFVRRTSNRRTALIGRVKASLHGTLAVRWRIDASGPNVAAAGEALSP